MPDSADTAASLTAAYHVIYDVKDGLTRGSYDWVVADNARRAVADLMRQTGIEVPRRFDAPEG